MPSDRPNKPHGRFTPASLIGRMLSQGGYGRAIIRKSEALGGHKCSWEPDQQRVWVRYQVRDITPITEQNAERTEMLDLYEELLTSKGYRVDRRERFLYVDMRKDTDMPKPPIEEQIEAVALIRDYAQGGGSPVADAVNTLDDAHLFAEIDQASDELRTQQKENPS